MEFYKNGNKKLTKFYNKNIESFINTATPLWYMTCTLVVNWMFDNHVIDYLYESGSAQSGIARCIGCILTVEMVTHWLFLCKVKSHYHPTKESNVKHLEHEKANPQFKSDGVAYDQLKRSCVGTSNWYVITHYTDTEVKKTAYPYWGWKPCTVCSCYKPPRCHHCPVCNVCVLKRDHHCFFARQCVGLNNQRYFLVFNFWAVLATAFFIPQLVWYTKLAIWPSMYAMELFLPWTVASYFLGWSSLYTLILMSQNWSLAFYFLLAGAFFVEQLKCIDSGKTSYELKKHDCHRYQSSYGTRRERFACVFGETNILLNFILPCHWFSKPTDDGITWNSIKMH
ncbi:palmitoyltransferase ZDHHC20-B-like [Watersipora subatra]|uniref:palmitoyltransferase ZDHHC20-B-like n=1 Tax=Watersipora subatra TaxID=2589382 RepID=UPI00355B9421